MSMEINYKVYVHIAPNGKRYYGITKKEKVEKRWGKNGKGYQGNEHFTRAINKYGWDNFEHIVIARGLTEEEAKWLEIELIREHDTTNPKYGYNITKGGDSNPMDNEESRKKMSESLKGENNPNYGKTLSEDTRKKLSEANKGKVLSEETRRKISESNKGKNNPMYGKTHTEGTRKKISENLKGKTHTEETRKKMSEAKKGENNPNYGKTFSEEHRRKLSESHKGKNSYNAKQVYCVELDKCFDTIIEGAEYVGCNYQNISAVLRGERKTAGGFHWLYAKDRDKLAS